MTTRTEHAALDERVHADPRGGVAGNFFAVHYDNGATKYFREPSATTHGDQETWFVNPRPPHWGKGYSQYVKERDGVQPAPASTRYVHNPFESRLFANAADKGPGSWQIPASKEPKGIHNPFGRPYAF